MSLLLESIYSVARGSKVDRPPGSPASWWCLPGGGLLLLPGGGSHWNWFHGNWNQWWGWGIKQAEKAIVNICSCPTLDQWLNCFPTCSKISQIWYQHFPNMFLTFPQLFQNMVPTYFQHFPYFPQHFLNISKIFSNISPTFPRYFSKITQNFPVMFPKFP